MELNMKHVLIYNAITIPLIVLGLIFNQNTLLIIGLLGTLAEMLPISLALISRIFREEAEPIYNNQGKIVSKRQSLEIEK